MTPSIQLLGPIADRLGRNPVRFKCDSIQRLWSGLQRIYPDFRAIVSEYDELAIAVRKNGEVHFIPQEELQFGFGGAEEIYLSAGTTGSAVAAATWVVGALELTGTAAALATAITYVAVAVAMSYATSAVMQSLTDKPDTSKAEREKHASYLYNGAQNIVEQGGAIAYVAGKHRVGGTIISSELSTDRLAMMMPDTYQITAGGTFTGNVLSNDIMREYLTVTGWEMGGTTYTPGDTYTHLTTTAPFMELVGSGEDAQWVENPGSLDGYTIRLEANGKFTVVTESKVFATHKITYTAMNSSDGRSDSTTAALKITYTVAWDGGGGEGPGSTGGEAGGGGDTL